MRSAAGARHAPGRAMAFAARAAGQGASLLSSRPCAPIAEIILRHGPVERHALAEYPKRIAKTALDVGRRLTAETEAARAGRADYGRLLPLQIRHMDCGCAVSTRPREDIRRRCGHCFASLACRSRSPLSARDSQRGVRPNRRGRGCRAVRAMPAPQGFAFRPCEERNTAGLTNG
jgi:hypothetical protein